MENHHQCHICFKDVNSNSSTLSSSSLFSSERQNFFQCQICDYHVICIDCYLKQIIIQLINRDCYEFFQKTKIYGVKNALMNIVSTLSPENKNTRKNNNNDDFLFPILCPYKCSSEYLVNNSLSFPEIKNLLIHIIKDFTVKDNYLIDIIISRYRDELDILSSMFSEHSKIYLQTSKINIKLQKKIRKSDTKIQNLKKVFKNLGDLYRDGMNIIDGSSKITKTPTSTTQKEDIPSSDQQQQTTTNGFPVRNGNESENDDSGEEYLVSIRDTETQLNNFFIQQVSSHITSQQQ